MVKINYYYGFWDISFRSSKSDKLAGRVNVIVIFLVIIFKKDVLFINNLFKREA